MNAGGLTLPSPKERVLTTTEIKVLSYGEDLGEATMVFKKIEILNKKNHIEQKFN